MLLHPCAEQENLRDMHRLELLCFHLATSAQQNGELLHFLLFDKDVRRLENNAWEKSQLLLSKATRFPLLDRA